MFLKPYTVISAEFAHVKAVMLRKGPAWMDGLAHAAEERERGLLAHAGFSVDDHLGFASMRPGPPHHINGVISVLLYPNDPPSASPNAPAGTLDVAWLAPGMTHIAVLASYSVALAAPVDQAQLHRVLEAAELHFLHLVADRLMVLTGD